jgi:hypothetical protein
MGCPVRKVVKGGAGAVLGREVLRAEKILTAVRNAVSLPLTVKMRSGWDRERINCTDVARMAESCGVDALTVHPRTARQLFTGCADWHRIRDVKQAVQIPVIGNGDVKTCYDAERMVVETGCDGVMVGRAALGNPWIFAQVLAFRRGCVPSAPTPQMRLFVILSHIDLLGAIYDAPVAMNRFKAHMMHYLKGIRGVKALRRQVCSDVSTAAELRSLIKDFFDAYEAAHCEHADTECCFEPERFSA